MFNSGSMKNIYWSVKKLVVNISMVNTMEGQPCSAFAYSVFNQFLIYSIERPQANRSYYLAKRYRQQKSKYYSSLIQA